MPQAPGLSPMPAHRIPADHRGVSTSMKPAQACCYRNRFGQPQRMRTVSRQRDRAEPRGRDAAFEGYRKRVCRAYRGGILRILQAAQHQGFIDGGLMTLHGNTAIIWEGKSDLQIPVSSYEWLCATWLLDGTSRVHGKGFERFRAVDNRVCPNGFRPNTWTSRAQSRSAPSQTKSRPIASFAYPPLPRPATTRTPVAN